MLVAADQNSKYLSWALALDHKSDRRMGINDLSTVAAQTCNHFWMRSADIRHTITRLFRLMHLLRFDLLTTRARRVPDRTMTPLEELTLFESGKIKKWACLNFPGGCGEIISLSLNPNQ